MIEMHHRGDWGRRGFRWFHSPNRRLKREAMRLAEDLCLYSVLGRLYTFRSGYDGRFLRDSFGDSGYDNLEMLHGYRRNPGKNFRVNVNELCYSRQEPYGRVLIELSFWVKDVFDYIYDPIIE